MTYGGNIIASKIYAAAFSHSHSPKQTLAQWQNYR